MSWDKRAWGGNLWMGERTVLKGGIIKWDSSCYKHETLLGWERERVYVVFNGKSSFATGPIMIYGEEQDAFYGGRANPICTIDKPFK